MRTRGIATSMAVLGALALTGGLAGCMTHSGLYGRAAPSASTGQGPCGAGPQTTPCAVTNPQALQQSNETYLQRVPVPAAQVAAAQPLRRRVQRGLKALDSRQRLRPRAVRNALIAAGMPATLNLQAADDGTTLINPIIFGATPWANEKLCVYGSVAPHYVEVDVAGISEDGGCLSAQGNG